MVKQILLPCFIISSLLVCGLKSDTAINDDGKDESIDEDKRPFRSAVLTGSENDPPKEIVEAVFVNRYIEDGKIKEGQEATLVKPVIGDDVSHAGFITIDRELNSNLFFWFFKSRTDCGTDWENAPVVLWVQGGIGDSFFIGLFEENGPYDVGREGIKLRKHSWNQCLNVLYMDIPFGTGYSFTQSDGEIDSLTVPDVAQGAYDALKIFFELFPEIKNNSFYIAGESYASKYALNIADVICSTEKDFDEKIQLRGLFLGNPTLDPLNTLGWSDYLYQVGFLDEYQKDIVKRSEGRIRNLIRSKKAMAATNSIFDLYEYFKRKGVKNLENYALPYEYKWNRMDSYIKRSDVRQDIHAGSFFFNDGKQVYESLRSDIAKSCIHLIPKLLDQKIKIELYSGQNDVYFPYPQTEQVIDNLLDEYDPSYDAKRTEKLYDDHDDVYGYFRSYKNLRNIVLRNTGHRAIHEKPNILIDLISRFTNTTIPKRIVQ